MARNGSVDPHTSGDRWRLVGYRRGRMSIFLIKDLNGKNLAVFQPAEQVGRAIVRTEMSLITPGLSKVSGDNQSGVAGAVLSTPFVVEVRDQNGFTPGR